MPLNGSSMNIMSSPSKITLPKNNFSKMHKWMKLIKPKTSYEKQREKVVRRALRHLERQNYKVLKKLGEGTFGSVLAIRTPDMETKLALKIVMRDMTWSMEKSAWQTFDHPNVLPLVDTISLPESEMFLMPFHPKALNEMLEKHRFRKSGFKVVQGWLKETLSGLAYLHSRKICHLDLKADNVLVTSSNTAVLCDFSCINVTTERTRRYGLMRYYHPPEACMSLGENLDVDGEAFDIWSFGFLALYLFTNHWFELKLTQLRSWRDDVYPLLFRALQLPKFHRLLRRTFPRASVTKGQAEEALNLIQATLRLNEEARPRASDVLLHTLFKEDGGKLLDSDRMWDSNHKGCFQTVDVMPPVILDKDDEVSLIYQPVVLHDGDRGRTRAFAQRSIGQDFESVREMNDDFEFTEGGLEEESWPCNRPINIEGFTNVTPESFADFSVFENQEHHWGQVSTDAVEKTMMKHDTEDSSAGTETIGIYDVFNADELISTENSVSQTLLCCEHVTGNDKNQVVPEENFLVDNICDDVRMLINDMLTTVDFEDVTCNHQNLVIPDPEINILQGDIINDVKILMNDMMSTVELENVICNSQTHEKNLKEGGNSGLAQANYPAQFQENFADFSVFETNQMYCGHIPRNIEDAVMVQSETVPSHSMDIVENDGAARTKRGKFFQRFGSWIRKKFTRKSKKGDGTRDV